MEPTFNQKLQHYAECEAISKAIVCAKQTIARKKYGRTASQKAKKLAAEASILALQAREAVLKAKSIRLDANSLVGGTDEFRFPAELRAQFQESADAMEKEAEGILLQIRDTVTAQRIWDDTVTQ